MLFEVLPVQGFLFIGSGLAIQEAFVPLHIIPGIRELVEEAFRIPSLKIEQLSPEAESHDQRMAVQEGACFLEALQLIESQQVAVPDLGQGFYFLRGGALIDRCIELPPFPVSVYPVVVQDGGSLDVRIL